MKILVTGGAGFIGSAVIRLAVSRGHSIVNLDALTYASSSTSLKSVEESEAYRFEHVDIRNFDAVARVFQKHEPERYGVVEFDDFGKVMSIVEKPEHPASNYAVTGLYFVDSTACDRAKSLSPSARGELEITDLLCSYLQDGDLIVEQMGRGFAWLDTGTHNSLLDAGNFVRTLTERQGLQVGSPDEIAYHQNWINKSQLMATADAFGKNLYGNYLSKLAST